MTIVDFIQARESEKWEHDPYGELPDEEWNKLMMVQAARLSIAVRALVFSIAQFFWPFDRYVRKVAAEHSDHPDYNAAWQV